jgi:murein DD-endopeptidase MepM/ murein hydrolase activator NlpD
MWELVSRFDPRSVYHSGPFLLPVTGGRRTSHFGDRRTYRYVDGASANAVHWGIDIAAPTGTPVRAGGAGRVVMVADRVISGNTVVIEHLPGVYGLHYHLDETRVEAGDTVSATDIVGTVGATGLATGPHLHWEVRVSRVPVEPEVLLSAGLIDIDAISENIMDADGTPQ